MAKNTHLKELTTDVKRILEIMEFRDRESNARFETIEATVDTLLKNSQNEGNSSRHSQPFQVAIVQDYYVQFTTLANRVTGLTADALLDCFIGGLKPDIRRDVIAQEMLLRREKGLCYTCDENFSPNHRCPNKQYLWLHMKEEDIVDLDTEPSDQVSEPQNNATQEHHLSYNALNGSSGRGTMKFQGVINGMTVQVLLDGGSSDNFLQPRLAHCLKLPVEPIRHIQVVVGNGVVLTVEG
ncbi:Aspartic peptidase domain superfamily [Sesbania bispinosa]|nr:Aspartic peptidase domain superfamily [Sesbania bispinosa]